MVEYGTENKLIFPSPLQKSLCKDRVFFVRDIDGVVLGSGNGCNVVYGRDYQVLGQLKSKIEEQQLAVKT